jgi:DNA-binding transcriptional LysR family regulator
VVTDDQFDLENLLSVFPDEFQSFNAALQGRGVALVPDYLIEAELASGEIVHACEQRVPARFSYYFVWPAGVRPNPARDAFRDWLLQAFGRYRDD